MADPKKPEPVGAFLRLPQTIFWALLRVLNARKPERNELGVNQRLANKLREASRSQRVPRSFLEAWGWTPAQARRPIAIATARWQPAEARESLVIYVVPHEWQHRRDDEARARAIPFAEAIAAETGDSHNWATIEETGWGKPAGHRFVAWAAFAASPEQAEYLIGGAEDLLKRAKGSEGKPGDGLPLGIQRAMLDVFECLDWWKSPGDRPVPDLASKYDAGTGEPIDRPEPSAEADAAAEAQCYAEAKDIAARARALPGAKPAALPAPANGAAVPAAEDEV